LNKSIHIIGAGNPLYGDDGVAQEIIQQMKSKSISKKILFHDILSDPFALLEKFHPTGLNILIDAARMKSKPGTLKIFSPEDVSLPTNWTHFSLHGICLPEIFVLAKQLEIYPIHLLLIGIEPLNFGMNQPLSDTIKKIIPDIIDIIELEVKKYEKHSNYSNH
jgi:hydrogenase maturation protease